MDRTRPKKRKLHFSAIELTPVYRPLKFPLHREAVVDEEEDDDAEAAGVRSLSSTTLPLPATLGRRNLSHSWWSNCPRKCKAYKLDLMDDACDSCFRIRGVRERGRTALSQQMVEINSHGDIQVVARHSRTIKIVDRNGARMKSLFDDEGKRKVAYLIVRDRRGPQDPIHTMVFGIRLADVGVSHGPSKNRATSCGQASSFQRSSDSSSPLKKRNSRREPHVPAQSSVCPPVSTTPPQARRSDDRGTSEAQSTSFTKATLNRSRVNVVTPAKRKYSFTMTGEPTHPTSQRQDEELRSTPRPRQRSGSTAAHMGLSSGSDESEESDLGDRGRTKPHSLSSQKRLSFDESESPPIKQPNQSSSSALFPESISEPDGEMATQVKVERPRLLDPPRMTQNTTQSTVLVLPRQELLTLSMQETTQLQPGAPSMPERGDVRCRNLTLSSWMNERSAAAPDSFKRAVVDLILHVNQQESVPDVGSGLWLPSMLDSECVLAQSALALQSPNPWPPSHAPFPTPDNRGQAPP